MKQLLLVFLMISLGVVNANANEPKKVVILYASIGNGHKNAAETIRAETLKLDPSVMIEVRDVMDFAPRWVPPLIVGAYDFATQKLPSVYNRHFNWALETMSKLDSLSKTKSAFRFLGDQKLLKYLDSVQPDILFSTFNHTTEGLIAIEKEGRYPNMLIGSTLTDYVSHEYYKMMINESHMTFVPSQDLLEYYLEKGADPDRVAVSTIPVAPELKEPLTEEQRESLFKEHGLDPRKTTLLLISGAAGVGNYKQILSSIIDSRSGKSGDLQVVVVAGRNAKNLKAAIKIAKWAAPELTMRVHPLVPMEVAQDLIRMSDLVVTKAGGLTSTELAMASKPAILLDINGGQERYNCEYFRACGGVEVTAKQKTVGALVDRILETPGRLEKMGWAQAQVFSRSDHPTAVAEWMAEALSSKGERPVSRPGVRACKQAALPVKRANSALEAKVVNRSVKVSAR